MADKKRLQKLLDVAVGTKNKTLLKEVIDEHSEIILLLETPNHLYYLMGDEYEYYTYKDWDLHSLYDQPAAKFINENKSFCLMWYEDGKLHRDHGPAKIENKIAYHYYEGKLHRNDGPAVYATEDATGDLIFIAKRHEALTETQYKERIDKMTQLHSSNMISSQEIQENIMYAHNKNNYAEYWHHGTMYKDKYDWEANVLKKY